MRGPDATATVKAADDDVAGGLQPEAAVGRLCELNVLGRPTRIYTLRDGPLRDLKFTASAQDQVSTQNDCARAAIRRGTG